MVRDTIRRSVRVVALVLGLGWVLPMAGCTSLEPFTAAQGDRRDVGLEHTGSIGLELDVASGITLHSVVYAISGNGFVKDGDIDVSQSSALTAVIGGIPAGDGFVITITAISIDGTATCVGSATFSVREDLTTRVTIHLQCRLEHRFGRIDINGDVNICASIDELTAAPMETGVDGTITLVARASDADGPESAIDMTFSDGATSLSQHGHGTSVVTLTCVTPGPDRIALTISDGECLQASSVDLVCAGAGGGSQATWIWKQIAEAPSR